MPIYDFVCDASHCSREGEPFESILSIADRDLVCVPCPDCGTETPRQVVPLKAPMCVMMKKQETSDRQIPERLLP
jgi:hypothetical protein